jgi:short-subunit dehydrogenase
MTPPDPRSGHALVTGASSGIGAEFARAYAARGVPLILTARRLERLETLAAELRAQVPVTVIAADLAKPETPARLHEECTARGLHVAHLANNAGYGVPGRLLSSPWDTHADFVQVMMTAPVALAYRFLPEMQAAGFGRIINVASLAGLTPASAGHTLYGASKAFLIRFSESLAAEVRGHGVHVTALCPGFTRSEFHDVNRMRERVSRLPAWLWMPPAPVVAAGLAAADAGITRVVPGVINRLVAGLSRHLPAPLVHAMIAGQSRHFRNTD